MYGRKVSLLFVAGLRLGIGLALCMGVAGATARAGPVEPGAAESSIEPVLLFSNSIDGEPQGGDIEQLRAAVQEGAHISVNWGTWHGRVTADCREIREDADKTFVCVAEVWCHESSGDVPAEHGHRSRVYSSGEVSNLILTARNDHKQTIFGVGRGRSNVDWYRKGPAPETPPAKAVASR